MVTAFLDMIGTLIVVPLLPFYALRFGAGGMVVGLLVSAFAVAQLVSAPYWGRISDRYGRRPALMIGLGGSAIAFVIFAFSDSLWLLFLSRIVQGLGGGTVSVVQAYVADATTPENRAKGLGWLSAASSAGVALGPALGSYTHTWGVHWPGLIAGAMCLVNVIFVWRYLAEPRDAATLAHARQFQDRRRNPVRRAVVRVLRHGGERASRLIWIYAIAMGAFQVMTVVLALFLQQRFGVTERTIGHFFSYTGSLSIIARAGLLGPAVNRFGEVRLSRIGTVLLALGLALLPLTHSVPMLALVVALVPLGTAFTFPCVTALLSRVVGEHERGLYMGVQQTFGGVARVLGPLWAGFAYEQLGTGVPFWTSAALVLGTLALSFGLDPRPIREPVAEPKLAS